MAAGTVGSIAGTFATGFILISAFGTHVDRLGGGHRADDDGRAFC